MSRFNVHMTACPLKQHNIPPCHVFRNIRALCGIFLFRAFLTSSLSLQLPISLVSGQTLLSLDQLPSFILSRAVTQRTPCSPFVDSWRRFLANWPLATDPSTDNLIRVIARLEAAETGAQLHLSLSNSARA